MQIRKALVGGLNLRNPLQIQAYAKLCRRIKSGEILEVRLHEQHLVSERPGKKLFYRPTFTAYLANGGTEIIDIRLGRVHKFKGVLWEVLQAKYFNDKNYSFYVYTEDEDGAGV